MAAVIKTEKWMGNRVSLKHIVQAEGTGVPADTDSLSTNIKQFPIGSEYIDTTNGIVYKRLKGAGVAADWYALTGTAV